MEVMVDSRFFGLNFVRSHLTWMTLLNFVVCASDQICTFFIEFLLQSYDYDLSMFLVIYEFDGFHLPFDKLLKKLFNNIMLKIDNEHD